MTHAERVSAVAALGFTRAPGGIPRARDAAFRCLSGAPVLHVCAASSAARRWPTSSRS